MAIEWRPGATVAWTESDGPGRVPPSPSRRTGAAAAVALLVAFVGMLTSDSVCPDHALWINLVASVTLAVGITAIVATLKSSPAAVLLSLLSATGGVLIAGIEVEHGATGARLMLLAFAVAALVSGAAAITAVKLRMWERSVLAEALAPEDPSAAHALDHLDMTAMTEHAEGSDTVSQ